MNIHLFRAKVENSDETISSALNRIRGTRTDRRDRLIGHKTMWLEHCEDRNGLYDMDFTQQRTRNGPGHAVVGEETRDFDINPEAGDGFGEQTVAVWSEAKGYMAVQYNHRGVRPGAVAGYLTQFLNDNGKAPWVSLTPVIDNDAYARFARSAYPTILNFAVDAKAITPQARENLALGAALTMSQATLGAKVEVTVSYGSEKRGGRLSKEIVNRLRGQPGIEKLNAKVKDVDGATEWLDLLEQRTALSIEDNDLPLTRGLRYDRGSCIRAIREVFGTWLQQH